MIDWLTFRDQAGLLHRVPSAHVIDIQGGHAQGTLHVVTTQMIDDSHGPVNCKWLVHDDSHTQVIDWEFRMRAEGA